MSFRCQGCGEVSANGEKCHRTVVEVRQKAYYSKRFVKNGEPQLEGSGMEIAKEMNLCGRCANPQVEEPAVEGY